MSGEADYPDGQHWKWKGCGFWWGEQLGEGYISFCLEFRTNRIMGVMGTN